VVSPYGGNLRKLNTTAQLQIFPYPTVSKLFLYSNAFMPKSSAQTLTFKKCDGQTDTTTVLRPIFRDHPGEPVPEENFWTLWCNGRLTEADTLTILLGATPSGLTSANLHHPPHFLQAGCTSCRPTNSIKALKATSAFRLGSRVLLNGDTCTVSVPRQTDRQTKNSTFFGRPGSRWNPRPIKLGTVTEDLEHVLAPPKLLGSDA